MQFEDREFAMSATTVKALQIVVVTTSMQTEIDDPELQQGLLQRSASLRIALLQAGYDILAMIPGDIYLVQRIQQLQPDLIIIDAESDARDVLEDLVIASRQAPRPMVLFTEHSDDEQIQAALRAGVSAYVVAGMQKERIKPVLDVALVLALLAAFLAAAFAADGDGLSLYDLRRVRDLAALQRDWLAPASAALDVEIGRSTHAHLLPCLLFRISVHCCDSCTFARFLIICQRTSATVATALAGPGIAMPRAP